MPTEPSASIAAADSLLNCLVSVAWDDAAFDLDAPPDVIRLTTVGWLYAADAASVTVASEADSDLSYFRSFTVIPASLVRQIRLLTPE